MFVIPSYQFQVSDWKDKELSLLRLYDNVQFTNDDPESNVHTDYGQDKHVESVCNILNDDLQRFCNHYMLQNVQVYNAWFQKYNDGQFHAPHNHGPVGWSCVLYIEFDPEVHGATRFIAPYMDISGMGISHTPQVTEGTILFFPSMLIHYVSPSKTDKTRVILSMNLGERDPSTRQNYYISQ